MTRRLSSALFLTICTLALIGLTTFNGLLTASTRSAGAALALALALLMLLAAWRRPAAAPPSPLDGPIALWFAAIGLSALANLDDLRQISTGAWFAGWYAVVFLGVWQALARRWISRATLIDAALLVGAVGLLIGALQASRGGGFPVSFLGNTNAFGLLLVLVLPLAAGRARHGHRWTRPAMALYTAAGLALLFATGSRGALIGGLAGLAVWLSLEVWLNRAAVAAVWARWPRGVRRAVAVAGAATLLIGFGGLALLLARSFAVPGRTLDLRTWIYSTALEVFAAQPVAGSGLFTFGAELMRLNSTPFHEPHSHAHNLTLTVLAELGLAGALALLLTAAVVARRAWRGIARAGAGGPVTAAAGAALVGLGVHTLFDMPLMMPSLALLAALVLAAALAPHEPEPRAASPAEGLRRWAVPALGLLLAAFALRDVLAYQQAIGLLTHALSNGDYAAGAAWLRPLAEADAASPVLHEQRGMLLALANDPAGAAEAYAQAAAAEPERAALWINLAALHLAAGHNAEAQQAAAEALRLAPDMASAWAWVGALAADRAAAGVSEPLPPRPIGEAPAAADWVEGANVNYAQHLHLAIPRVFVPQLAPP